MTATLKERLAEFLAYLGVGQAKFAEMVGLSKAFANNVGDSIRMENLRKIKKMFPELNTTWLLTGDGEMLRNVENVAHSDYGGISVAGTGNVVANGRDTLALGRRGRKGAACPSCDRLTTENQRLRDQIEKLTNDNMKLIERVNTLTDKLLEKM